MSKEILVPARPIAPLPLDLRNSLLDVFVQQGAVTQLQSTLSTECHAAGWQTRLHERILQALRNGEAKSVKELEKMLLLEATAGFKDDKNNTTQSDINHRQLEDEKTARTKAQGQQDDKVIDIKLPRCAVDNGTQVVRETLLATKEIQVEDETLPAWHDWK